MELWAADINIHRSSLDNHFLTSLCNFSVTAVYRSLARAPHWCCSTSTLFEEEETWGRKSGHHLIHWDSSSGDHKSSYFSFKVVAQQTDTLSSPSVSTRCPKSISSFNLMNSTQLIYYSFNRIIRLKCSTEGVFLVHIHLLWNRWHLLNCSLSVDTSGRKYMNLSFLLISVNLKGNSTSFSNQTLLTDLGEYLCIWKRVV